jgi:hypothetical protein
MTLLFRVSAVGPRAKGALTLGVAMHELIRAMLQNDYVQATANRSKLLDISGTSVESNPYLFSYLMSRLTWTQCNVRNLADGERSLGSVR